MAAQQTPPLTKSANQQLEQASASLNTHLGALLPKPEQLEHQPTNAVLQQQQWQCEHELQQQRRQFELQQQQFEFELELQFDQELFEQRLRQQQQQFEEWQQKFEQGMQQLKQQMAAYPQTNTPIPSFPKTSAQLTRLTWPQKRALGISLGMNDLSAYATRGEKTAFIQQLRDMVGL